MCSSIFFCIPVSFNCCNRTTLMYTKIWIYEIVTADAIFCLLLMFLWCLFQLMVCWLWCNALMNPTEVDFLKQMLLLLWCYSYYCLLLCFCCVAAKEKAACSQLFLLDSYCSFANAVCCCFCCCCCWGLLFCSCFCDSSDVIIAIDFPLYVLSNVLFLSTIYNSPITCMN